MKVLAISECRRQVITFRQAISLKELALARFDVFVDTFPFHAQCGGCKNTLTRGAIDVEKEFNHSPGDTFYSDIKEGIRVYEVEYAH